MLLHVLRWHLLSLKSQDIQLSNEEEQPLEQIADGENLSLFNLLNSEEEPLVKLVGGWVTQLAEQVIILVVPGWKPQVL